VGSALALAASVPPAAAQSVQPNLIVIMTDDLDSGSLQTALDQGLMPNLKTYVADVGVTFANSFATFPLCCPSRATYLTGLYPHNTGVVWNSGPNGGFANFDDSSTIATWLQAAGYRTGHVGKYLNGYNNAAYVPPGWDDWQGLTDPSTYCMYGYTVSDNGVAVVYGNGPADYQTDVLRQRALDFINESEAEDGSPFFLTVTPLAPHLESSCRPDTVRAAPRHEGTVNLPLPMPVSFNEADMSDKPLWMRALPLVDVARTQQIYNDRLEALRAVDDLVGAVLQALSANGELARTSLAFTSDNGYLLGRHRWESKVLAYEESIRVPLLLRQPGGTARTITALVLNNDLAPTLAAAAGVAPGLAVDGRSLLPLLDGTSTNWRKRFLVDHPATGESFGVPPYLAVRTASSVTGAPLAYVETYNDAGTLVTARELYDLALDPFQVTSLHNDMSPLRVTQRLSLAQHLQNLKSCGNGTCQTYEDR
jgi:arylsulfatase A-like enzyme